MVGDWNYVCTHLNLQGQFLIDWNAWSRGKLMGRQVSRRVVLRVCTYTNMVQWSIGMWRRLQCSCTQMFRGCTDRKWGEEVMRSVIIGLSMQFCIRAATQEPNQQICVGGGKNLNPALFLFFSPKALCFFMLMMTIAWHRDLVQTGKVGFSCNNLLLSLWITIYLLIWAPQTRADVLLNDPPWTYVYIYILFLSSRPHVCPHLPIKVSLGKAVNYPPCLSPTLTSDLFSSHTSSTGILWKA